MTDFDVPQESIVELLCAMQGLRAEWTRNDVVRAIAAPVVAAELRKQAYDLEAGSQRRADWQVWRRHAQVLRLRADELDGSAS